MSQPIDKWFQTGKCWGVDSPPPPPPHDFRKHFCSFLVFILSAKRLVMWMWRAMIPLPYVIILRQLWLGRKICVRFPPSSPPPPPPLLDDLFQVWHTITAFVAPGSKDISGWGLWRMSVLPKSNCIQGVKGIVQMWFQTWNHLQTS